MTLSPLSQNILASLTYGTAGRAGATSTDSTWSASPTAVTTNNTQSSLIGSGAQISLSARVALAEAADNAKSFDDVTTEVRANFDAQYKVVGTAAKQSHLSPDVSELSGRALAAVILNKTGSFSAQEVQTAKTELNSRTRIDVISLIGPGRPTMAGIAAYNQKMVSTFDSISPEERQARGWSDHTREQAAQAVQQLSTPSLFDQLDTTE